MNMDCAWCGTGEGICEEHAALLFAQSAEIAASGVHLAGNRERNTEEGQTEQEQTAPAA